MSPPDNLKTAIKDTLQKAAQTEDAIFQLAQVMGFNTFPSPPPPPLPEEDFNDLPERTKDITNRITQLATHNSSGLEFHLWHINLNTPRIRRTDIRTVVEPLLSRYPHHFLFVFTCGKPPFNEIAFVSPYRTRIREKETKKHIRIVVRTLLVDPRHPYFTDLQVLEQASVKPDLSGDEVWERHKTAFSVHRITDQFYKDFRDHIFKPLKEKLQGAGLNDKEAHNYALMLLNRIMFLYFIQRRGWLGTTQFMRQFWQAYRDSKSRNYFLRNWLNPLFFTVFNNPPNKRNLSMFPSEIAQHLKNAPYLNGGLFRETSHDPQPPPKIDDDTFIHMFERWIDGTPNGFFERYNFTVLESGPYDQLVAVDPEMIGRVYESLVHIHEPGKTSEDVQSERGIFYTPRTEVDLMCRLAVSDFLINHLGEQHRNTILQWVFSLLQKEKKEADERIHKEGLTEQLYSLLENIAVCDPACGSGAFLVGMLLVLDDLQQRLQKLLGINEHPYHRRKRIIGRNLYGVDIMQWAVHIAELRLWLQLAVETEIPDEILKGNKPLLPNLSFNLRPSDSLLQKIGDAHFTLHASEKAFHEKFFADKLRQLKNKKLAFYNAEPGAPSEEALKKEELRVLDFILQWKIDEDIPRKIKHTTERAQRELIKTKPTQRDLTIQN